MSRVGFLNRLFVVLILPSLLTLASVSFAGAQDGKTDGADPAAADSSATSAASPSTPGTEKGAAESDPLKRPLTEKQRKQNSKSLKIELSKTYKKWLDEDVRWIITDEEQKAFKLLSTPSRTNSKKSITGAWLTPTNISPPAFRVGKATAAEFM